MRKGNNVAALLGALLSNWFVLYSLFSSLTAQDILESVEKLYYLSGVYTLTLTLGDLYMVSPESKLQTPDFAF